MFPLCRTHILWCLVVTYLLFCTCRQSDWVGSCNSRRWSCQKQIGAWYSNVGVEINSHARVLRKAWSWNSKVRWWGDPVGTWPMVRLGNNPKLTQENFKSQPRHKLLNLLKTLTRNRPTYIDFYVTSHVCWFTIMSSPSWNLLCSFVHSMQPSY